MIKDIQTEELIKIYNQTKSIKKLSVILNCTPQYAGYLLKSKGIKCFNRYTFDYDFFKQETEQTYYWAGFIAADGCIYSRNNSDTLKIRLAIKDYNHLEKFKNHIKATNPIFKFSHHKYPSCEISLTSKILKIHLKKFNIENRKSLSYSFPKYLNNDLLNHFMRGYFDGDGSWYYSKNNIPQRYFSIRGTESFLIKYKEILFENLLISSKYSHIRNNCGTSILEFGGNNLTSKIRNYLYNNSTIYLDRKFLKAHLF